MLLLSAAKPKEMADPAQANSQEQDGYRIEEITRRAHEIHRERGGLVGYDFDDWAQAWQELSQMASHERGVSQ